MRFPVCSDAWAARVGRGNVTARVAALAAAGLTVATPDQVATGRWQWRLTSAGRVVLRSTRSTKIR